ncbi:MAG: acetylglutamate kinase [Candidatus Cryptobacteroides sp.]
MEKLKVIKIGGNVVDNPLLLKQFAKDFAALEGKKVLVHGGGVLASRIQKALGLEPVMIEGRRVTDGETLKIVTMVYAGWCSKNITALLQSEGCNAVGLSGADGNVIRAVRRAPVRIGGELVDYGFVGDVTEDSVNGGFLKKLTEEDIVPVLCAINHDGHGNLLNTNADTIASSVSVAMAKEGFDTELVYCFEKNGVLADREDEGSVISLLDREGFGRLKIEGKVADGMIPKLENAFRAIEAGVGKVVIKHASNLLNDVGTVLG